MLQSLNHQRLFFGTVVRVGIFAGSLPPLVGDCGKPTALLGAADVQICYDLAIC